jgi:hypothetical protein
MCDKDGTFQLGQRSKNPHLDVAKSLRKLFINDQKNYVRFLEIACQKGIPGMEKILQAELQKPGSTGIDRSWSAVSKILWFNKDDLFNKARNHPFNKDMFMVGQLAEQGRIFEAERLFKQHANLEMYIDDYEKHTKLCQYFSSLSNRFDLTYGILKTYQQDPFWKSYPHKETLAKDFLDYRDQKISYPQSVAQMQSLFKAREELKQACIKTYELTEFSNDPQFNELLYQLVDLGSDGQKHVQFLYDIFHKEDNSYHTSVKRMFFTDQGSLKIAEKNSSWAQIAERVQKVYAQPVQHAQTVQSENTNNIIELCQQGKSQEALRLILPIVDKEERDALKKIYAAELAKVCPETGIKKAFMADPWWLKFTEKDILRQQHKYYMTSIRGQLPKDIQAINNHLEARHAVITNWLNWSKIPQDSPQEIRTFLYNLMDSASDTTSCIEGFNKLLLNAHHPQDATLASYFFNEEGILRMYEDDQHALQFKVNKTLSWPVQRQITEYANKILSLKMPENTPLFVFEQLERAWGYIDAASQSTHDDQALVFAYIADGIFQALQGSEFHRELFNLPYLFDYDPKSHEYMMNYQQFEKIADALFCSDVKRLNLVPDIDVDTEKTIDEDNSNIAISAGGTGEPPEDPEKNKIKNRILLQPPIKNITCDKSTNDHVRAEKLVQVFNNSEGAKAYGLKMTPATILHVLHAHPKAELDKLVGGHFSESKCCSIIQVLRHSPSHRASLVKFQQNGLGKTSTIFNESIEKVIESMIEALEEGKIKLPKPGNTTATITTLEGQEIELFMERNCKNIQSFYPQIDWLIKAIENRGK